MLSEETCVLYEIMQKEKSEPLRKRGFVTNGRAGTVNVPILFIHERHDVFIPWENSKKLDTERNDLRFSFVVIKWTYLNLALLNYKLQTRNECDFCLCNKIVPLMYKKLGITKFL